MSDQQRTCKGTCKKFHVKKPTNSSRYGSGQALCQICNTWMDYHGCHMKDGSPAKEETLGWFCNCCNFRVRQRPRNRIYKEKLNTFNLQKHDNSKTLGDENKETDLIDLTITSENPRLKNGFEDLNSYQINLIKEITPILSNHKSSNDSDKIRKELQSSGKSIMPYIQNWGSWENFIALALVDFPPNRISLIVEFERVKNFLGNIPQKIEFYEHSKYGIDRYQKEFSSWESFLELIHYPMNLEAPISSNQFISDVMESNAIDVIPDHTANPPSQIDTMKLIDKINSLRSNILGELEKKDMESVSIDYIYRSSFQLLEKYLDAIPKYYKLNDLSDLL